MKKFIKLIILIGLIATFYMLNVNHVLQWGTIKEDNTEHAIIFSSLSKPEINDYVIYQANEKSKVIGQVIGQGTENYNGNNEFLYKIKLPNNPKLKTTIKADEILSSSIIVKLIYHKFTYYIAILLMGVTYILILLRETSGKRYG